MRQRLGRLAALATIAVVFAGLLGGAAQEGTPGALPTIPAPDECRVAPRSLEAVEQILAAGGTPAPQRAVEYEWELPPGRGAPADVVAAAVAAEREYAACYNAADWPRLLALFADDTLPAFFEDAETPRELFAAVGTPFADVFGVQRIVLVAVRNVRVLPNGRIGAVVEWGRAGEFDRGTDEANFRIYAPGADRLLLVDEIGSFVPWYQGGGTPPAWQTDATPTLFGSPYATPTP